MKRTVTIPLKEYDMLKKRVEEAEKETGRLVQALIDINDLISEHV